jgi:hypothetical protein
MSDFEVTGADQFLRLSKALKNAGKKRLRTELNKGLREGVKKAMPDAERRLAEALPYSSGKPVTQVVQVKTGRDPGVTVGVRFGSKRHSNAVLANREGQIRHPVFKTGAWVSQPVPAKGWFDETYANAAPLIRPALEAVLEDIAQKVIREAG